MALSRRTSRYMSRYQPCAVFPQYRQCPVIDPINCNSRYRCSWYKKLRHLTVEGIDYAGMTWAKSKDNRLVFLMTGGKVERMSYDRIAGRIARKPR